MGDKKAKKGTMNAPREASGPEVDPDRPISGPGAHPTATGIGAASGGALGAALGALGGPVVAVAGAVIGAMTGGYIGEGIAERINPAAEEEYWREHYRSRPYVEHDIDYEEFKPAYRYGWEARARHHQKTFEEIEPDLRRYWESARGSSSLGWEKARDAACDAWDRIHHKITAARDASEHARRFDANTWRSTFAQRPYISPGAEYSDYEPAYRFGWQTHEFYRGRPMEQIEPQLALDWETFRGNCSLDWPQAKLAILDVWDYMNRIELETSGMAETETQPHPPSDLPGSETEPRTM